MSIVDMSPFRQKCKFFNNAVFLFHIEYWLEFFRISMQLLKEMVGVLIDAEMKNMNHILIGSLLSIEQVDPHFKPDVVALFEEYSDMVYRIAFVRSPQPTDAEDIFQEVFLRLVKHLGKLRSREHAKAWLIRCTLNCCNSHHQSAWQKKTVGLDEHTGRSDLSYDHIILLDAVRALTLEHQEVIHLFYYEGYGSKEIAELLNIKENTVKSRLRRARMALRSVWMEEEDTIDTK